MNNLLIKREKGFFYKKSTSVEDALEEHFDLLVKQINQVLKKTDEKTETVVSQVIDIGGRTPLDPSVVAVEERIIYGGENRNIIRRITAFDLLTSVSLTISNDRFTKVGHGLINGDLIRLSSIVGTGGINITTIYSVSNVSGDTFQVSIPGGGIVDLTSSDGSCSVRKVNLVLPLVSVQAGDLIKSVTVITDTGDSGTTEFSLSDGSSNLLTLDDVDVAGASVSTPPKLMWLGISTNKTFTLTMTNATTFSGTIVFEIIKSATQYQGAIL